ncbi:peptide-N-glycosidase F-related protein [Pedobacter nyackensis]|uniref:Peptide-N-glycosidase F, N terminal n=1 Tax=Pedobacter nyackensis TaxID=475255 RepID=A0A1W2F9H9_9SPHI|nr:peptide-N-glycosidase F-related protein [Pedobacter nyackensis]SMD18513.1 Peptide-N-glycosidase F, N terminal [Pedobacter nyackensis]
MKRYLLLLLTGISSTGLMAQKNADVPFQLQGTVNLPSYDSANRAIYFTYQKNGKEALDSAVIKDNKFSFRSTADVDIKALLQFTKPKTSPNVAADPNSLSLYLSKGLVNISAKGYLRKSIISGSVVNNDYMAFKKPYLKLDTSLRLLGWKKKRVKAGDAIREKIVDAEIDSVKNLKLAQLSEFLSKNITKPYAAEALLIYVSTDGSAFNVNKAQQFFDQLPAKQKTTTLGKEITTALSKLAEQIVTINVLKNVDFYDGYAAKVAHPVAKGVTRISNAEYLRQLSPAEIDKIGKTLKVKVTIKSGCDNYDRIGHVTLVVMPKGEQFNLEKGEQFELLRIMTPFMYRTRQPDHIPYEAQIDQMVSTIKQAGKDVYLLTEVFGTTGAGQREVIGCDGSLLTFNVSVDLISDKTKDLSTQKGISLLSYYSLDGKDKTAGKNSKQVSFELPDDTKTTVLYLISSGHGAAEGGEEYNWREHIVDLNGKEYTRLEMSQNCAPFEMYNTQPNGIYFGDIGKERRSWCPGGPVPTRIINLGPLAKGKHTLKISIPEAEFEKTDSKYYVSAYLITQ